MRKSLVFAEFLAQAVIEDFGIFKVVTEGFFDHQAAPANGFLVQAMLRQVLSDCLLLSRRQGQVEHEIGRESGSLLQAVAEPLRGLWVLRVPKKILQTIQKAGELLGVDALTHALP